jgi:regulator of protease activity HflC (stomatin/prohibitin superfamily)
MARRRRRKKKKQKSVKQGLGEPIFIGLAVVFAIIPFFLKDYTGVQYRWAGTYIWLAAYFFAFGGYLFYLLMFILPLSWNLSWFEGLRLSIAYNFPIIGAFLGVGSRRPAATAECREDLNPGFLRHRAGIVEGHKALVLSSGSKYMRAAGPGYVHLKSNEIITQVVDLRRHIRTVPVKAMSGDGIPLETSITLTFQVRQQDTAAAAIAYPYDPEAIFWVNYLESFKSSSGELAWSDRAAHDATAEGVEELSRYTLDELLSQSLTDVSTISQARARLKKKLSANLEEYGITLINVAIGSLRMPEEVIERRIESWQDEIQDRIERSMATEKEQAKLQLIEAEAKAQIELVDKLTREIEVTWAEGDVDLAGAVILQLLDQLALVASDREVRALIPADTMTTVEQVETWISNQGNS